jgi:nitrogen fixation protein FixH
MAEITGRHVLAITTSAFAVIIAVNLTLAYKAVSTFPGLEVRNSYVASQGFDERRRAQTELGWTLTHAYDAGTGQLSVALTDATGAIAEVSNMKVLVGRATEARDDTWPQMVKANGKWAADLALTPGKWMMKVEAMSKDGVLFEQRVGFMVKG